MKTSKRTATMFLCALLFVLSACGGTPAPTQTPFIIFVTAGPTSSGVGVGVGAGVPTPAAGTSAPTQTTAPANTVEPTPPPAAPANTVAPTAQPAESTSAPVTLVTYKGVRAPFTVKYPSDWTVVDPEKNSDSVAISSADQSELLGVTYSMAGTQTPDEVLASVLKKLSTPEPKVTNQTTNIDGSIKVELEYTTPSGTLVREVLRVVKQAASEYSYAIFFTTAADKFAQARALGMTLVNSFQELMPIVRATPPIIARPTVAPTAIPEAATDTPVPTDTPEPTSTNTPRPPVALFQLDAQARGYESWGAPKDGCNSGATGQWDNNHPIKRLTIDLTLTNKSGRTIQESDVLGDAFSNTGASLLICLVSNIPTTPAGGSSNFGITTFVEPNQFLAVVRMTIFGSTLRTCFGHNNPPSVVACG